MHKEGKEFPFVKDELPLYAEKYGGEVVGMTTEEEADFLMLCNDMEHIPGVKEMLDEFEKDRIPMYVLSNSGFTAKSLWVVLDRFGIGQYFSNVWSSADFGKIKPCREFFDMAVDAVLLEHPEERKEDILFIGDTYNTDVIGAHDAGIKAVWINRKKEEDVLKYATYQIAETRDLLDVVRENQSEGRFSD
jgi:putative hydrolase of the HAD superfamily